MSPFFILALPRSRTTWLSQYLSYNGRRCGHDIAMDCTSVADFISRLRRYDGTAETGAVLGWRLIRHLMPDARIVVVRRPVTEIVNSLSRLGISADMIELIRRDEMLDEMLSMARPVMKANFSDLDDAACRRAVFEYCLPDVTFDPKWDKLYAGLNIQVHMPHVLAKLQRNRAQIEGLKREVAAMIGQGAAQWPAQQ